MTVNINNLIISNLNLETQNNSTLNPNLNKNKNINININKKKTAFSLIELSIVLIIIGLLVAGITGGASLIKSAELRSAMNEIRNYQLAVNTYYAATGKLPGTNTSQIDFDKTGQAYTDMVNEGILDIKLRCFSGSAGSYTCNSNVAKIGTNYPYSKIKGAGYALGYNDEMADNVFFMFKEKNVNGIPNNYLKFITPTATGGFVPSSGVGPVLTQNEAHSLDTKLDDGIYDSGKFRSFQASSATCNYTSENKNSKDCASAIGIGL